MTLSLALRFATRDWRAGELRLLLAALVLAVAAVTAISLFVDRLQRALVAESATLLGADRVIDSSRAIPQRFRELAAARGLALADLIRFPSMVFAAGPDRSLLASVKAVTGAIPCAARCGSRMSRSTAAGPPTVCPPEARSGWNRACSRRWASR